MIIAYKSKYCRISYIPENALMEVVFNVSASDKTFNETVLLAENIAFKEQIERFSPIYLLVDTQEYYYNIPPKMQEWIAENIIQKAITLGMRKNAVVVSDELISQLSVEQTIEEGTNKLSNLEIMFKTFSEKKTALEWMGFKIK